MSKGFANRFNVNSLSIYTNLSAIFVHLDAKHALTNVMDKERVQSVICALRDMNWLTQSAKSAMQINFGKLANVLIVNNTATSARPLTSV